MKSFKTVCRKKHLSCLAGILFVLSCLLAAYGCNENAYEFAEDDGSYEAKLQEAVGKLDSSEYQAAYDLLIDLQASRPDDPELQDYISSACAGMAGLDSYRLLEIADELADSGDENGIDLVGLTLGTDGGYLTAAAIEDKLDRFSGCAIPQLAAIANPTDDQIIQLGLFSLNRAVLLLGDIIAENETLEGMRLSAAGIREVYQVPNFNLNTDISENLAALGQDIGRIGDALGAIDRIIGDDESSNDLKENFDRFLQDLDPNRDNAITEAELTVYINNLR